MHRIVFLDRATLNAELRPPAFEHSWAEHARTAPDEVAGRLEGATIAVVNKVKLGAEVLARLPALRMIGVAATGYDGVDLAACRARGIAVANIRDYAGHTVPEHVFALVLALRRNLIAYDRSVRQGRWQQAGQFCYFDFPIADLAGSTFGIVGAGAIGQGTARIARGFGMKVLFAEHRSRRASAGDGTGPVNGHGDGDGNGNGNGNGNQGEVAPLAALLAESDVISLHCPMTAATRGMIGEAELRSMKKTALLVNTARGGLVDEAALARALREGWIGGAGIDVLTAEPPKDGNPLLDTDLPNLIVTPHVAWASGEAMQFLADQLIGNLEAWVAGTPRNLVT